MRWLVALLAAMMVALGALSWWVKQQQDLLQQPVKAVTQTLNVPKGMVLGNLLQQLQQQGWIDQTPDVRVIARTHPELTQLKAGTYAVQGTLAGLLASIVAGQSVNYYFTIVPGWNLWQLQAALQAEERLVQTMPAQLDQWSERLGLTGWPEGQFLPDTYAFSPGSSDLALLKRAHAALQQQLESAWYTKQTTQLQSPAQLLTLASIIEKETAVASERTHIAGVFEQRLAKGMRLQTDPTVIYGLLPDFDGNITRRNLRQKTPYNTYVIKGLPPTPIAMPSAASIQAAAQPMATKDLFFVATGEGGHAFAETLKEHQKNVQAYLKRRRSQP